MSALRGMWIHALLVVAAAGCARPAPAGTAQASDDQLPDQAVAKLADSLAAASRHERHVWRDLEPFNPDGTLNAYVEISRGERTKWEFDIAGNRRAVDRVIDRSLGGYPVNYGFVPQTMSYDGDPFDVLVLGPALPGGTTVRGDIVGLMYMDDEKGRDMKVVISPVDDQGRALHRLTAAEKARIGGWFDVYKKPEAAQGKWSRVGGWGGEADGKRFVDLTKRFFEQGREKSRR